MLTNGPQMLTKGQHILAKSWQCQKSKTKHKYVHERLNEWKKLYSLIDTQVLDLDSLWSHSHIISCVVSFKNVKRFKWHADWMFDLTIWTLSLFRREIWNWQREFLTNITNAGFVSNKRVTWWTCKVSFVNLTIHTTSFSLFRWFV